MTQETGLSGNQILGPNLKSMRCSSLILTHMCRIRENGTESNWVDAKFELIVNPLPSLTTEADLPILADVSLPLKSFLVDSTGVIFRRGEVLKLSLT